MFSVFAVVIFLTAALQHCSKLLLFLLGVIWMRIILNN